MLIARRNIGLDKCTVISCNVYPRLFARTLKSIFLDAPSNLRAHRSYRAYHIHADALLVRRLAYLARLTPFKLIALLVMDIRHQKQPSS